MVLQNFYNGLTPMSKGHLDAAAGGAFLSLTTAGAKALIEKMVEHQSWGEDRTQPPAVKTQKGMHTVKETDMLATKIDLLMKQLTKRNQENPLSTKAGRQSTLGYTHSSSLLVDGAQATNSMMTQDTDKLFIQVRPPCGHNTYVLHLVVLICVEIIIYPRGVPCPSLYSPEGMVTNLETNPSRLQLP